MNHAFRRAAGLLSALVCGIALVGLLRLRAQTHWLRQQHNAQLVRYDSLMAAKLESDRRLMQALAGPDTLRRQRPADPLRWTD